MSYYSGDSKGDPKITALLEGCRTLLGFQKGTLIQITTKGAGLWSTILESFFLKGTSFK